MTRQKDPHTETIEVPLEDLQRAEREEGYSRSLREWREGSMKTGQWVELLKDDDFMAWAREL